MSKSKDNNLRAHGYMTIDEFVDKLSVGLRDYMHSNWRNSDKNDLYHPEDLASNASIYTEIAARVIGDFK